MEIFNIGDMLCRDRSEETHASGYEVILDKVIEENGEGALDGIMRKCSV